MALPRRKPNRLPNYDYSQAGYYFITLCTKDTQPLFWQPSVGADIIRPPQGIQRSSIGRVVDEAIRAIPAHYPNVALDKFVVMPNHFHALVEIERARADMESAPTIISIVQAFKRYSTVEYIRLVKRGQAAPFDKHLWQRSFHDHVIRGEADYRRIWSYIDANPRKWREDCYYV